MIRTFLVCAFCLLAFAHHKSVVGIEPKTADYSRNAFYPDRWKKAGVSFKMLAWKGKHVTLLTKPGQIDGVCRSLQNKGTSWEQQISKMTNLIPNQSSIGW